MIRAVLAVLLATALVATSTTAMDRAARARGDRLAESTSDQLVAEMMDLTRTEPGLARVHEAARRVVDVAVPDAGVATATVEYVAIGGVPGDHVENDTRHRDVVAYKLAGSPPEVQWVPVDVRVPADGPHRSNIPSRVPLANDDEPLVVEEPATLVLRLLSRDGRSVVLASRR
ncbi:MAG: hypothetical protein V5A23_06040 [Halobacteriales archaeon]